MFQHLRPTIDLNYEGRVRLVAREDDKVHGYRPGQDEEVLLHVKVVRDLITKQNLELSTDQAAVLGIAE